LFHYSATPSVAESTAVITGLTVGGNYLQWRENIEADDACHPSISLGAANVVGRKKMTIDDWNDAALRPLAPAQLVSGNSLPIGEQ
jgi:hypothetical protein